MPLIVCKCKLNRPTSQCEGRMPKQTPAVAPEGRGPRMGPRQCEGRMPKQTPAVAPEGRGPRMGPRQCEGRMPKQTPALENRQRVQFLVARNVQQDRSELRRGLFAEDAFEAVFGVLPQTPGFAQ